MTFRIKNPKEKPKKKDFFGNLFGEKNEDDIQNQEKEEEDT